MSKLFREWIENVDEDSKAYKDFIKQQEYDDWSRNKNKRWTSNYCSK